MESRKKKKFNGINIRKEIIGDENVMDSKSGKIGNEAEMGREREKDGIGNENGTGMESGSDNTQV